ncbi:MAG: TerD family protein [Planctomycetaceae bacterium]|jgi:tellurium resistance protein TerD|nr:TerD family protein [Planctomycetaceae bacterium]
MRYKIVLEYLLLDDYGFDYLDLSAFLLNVEGKAEGNSCFVYHGNPASDNNAVKFAQNEKANSGKNKKETITIDVSSIPANIHKIVFVVTAKEDKNSPEYIKQAQKTGICSLYTNTADDPVHCFEFADTEFDGGVIFYELVRLQSSWTERVIAAGNKHTLNDFATIYGVETKTILSIPKSPPPLPSLQQQQRQRQQLQQQNTAKENLQFIQLQDENKSLKQQLQLEQNRFAKLQAKYNQLTKEINRLLDQQLKNSNLLPELRMLFSESSQYHFSHTQLKNELSACGVKLSNAQNLYAVLSILEELRGWWNEYRVQNPTRLSFWRPDSWSRFEDKFQNHPITIKLRHFTE